MEGGGGADGELRARVRVGRCRTMYVGLDWVSVCA
jgi:hypothetical protein